VQIYFDCFPRSHDPEISAKAIREFYNSLGFENIDFDKNSLYEMAEKGGGMIRYDNDYLSKELKREGSIYPELPQYEAEEIEDMIASLKGDYTSEQGLLELMNMASHALDLMASKSKEDHYTDTKLMHDLMPGSITATGPELEKYKTKLEDVKYFIHRARNPSRRFIDAQNNEERRET
jgi:hypothetical protein